MPDSGSQLLDICYLHRIVGCELRQPVDGGNGVCDGRFMVGQKLRPECEQVAARATFGAANLQQHGVDLVLHLYGMHHPAIVLTGLVDENDRGHADRDQHEKSRREQQDLADRAAARGVNGHKGLG